MLISQAAIVHLNFRAGSTFPVPVCTVPHEHIGLIKKTINRTSRCHKVDAVRLYASYMLNLLLLNGKRCVICKPNVKIKYLNHLFFAVFFCTWTTKAISPRQGLPMFGKCFIELISLINY